MACKAWKCFPCCISELRLELTLKCGQSFRWKESSPGVWTGVIRKQIWRLKQDKTHLYYQVFNQNSTLHTVGEKNLEKTSLSDRKIKTEIRDSIEAEAVNHDKKDDVLKGVKMEIQEKGFKSKAKAPVLFVNIKEEKEIKKEIDLKSDLENEDVLRDYFQLNVNLGKLYKSWSLADSNFQEISSNFGGIRMLRQDPVENLFSFICSSNNHISRISSMVEKLCDHYGERIGEVDDKVYHSFPRVASLAPDSVEGKLRELGFGYRAKYINKTARYICDHHSNEWLYSLRSLSYQETKNELIKLCGVGAKVADCVCLMSMDKPGAIPVDTHVWQIAARHYMPKLHTSKSLTDKLYEEIGASFRSLWGEYAGWAHSVLFAADLKHFKAIKQKPTASLKRVQANEKGKHQSKKSKKK